MCWTAVELEEGAFLAAREAVVALDRGCELCQLLLNRREELGGSGVVFGLTVVLRQNGSITK